MKEKLILLSKENGFISKIIGKSVEAQYSNKDFYYLWMCELQKWFREEHNIHIVIIPTIETYWTFKVGRLSNFKDQPPFKEVNGSDYNTFEEALEEGLVQSFKLINNDKSNKKSTI